MRNTSILQRDGTEKLFKIVNLAHWSDIVCVDDVSDTDSVKCFGERMNVELYVSANKGYSYKVVQK